MELLTEGRVPPIGSATKRSDVLDPSMTSLGMRILVVELPVAVPSLMR